MNSIFDEWYSSEREGEETFSWDWVDFILCVSAALCFIIGLIKIMN